MNALTDEQLWAAYFGAMPAVCKTGALRAVADAAVAAAIPEGYALVPIEPTKEMLEAAQLADGDHGDHEDWLGFQWEMGMDQVWAAMLEAAKEVKS